MVGNNQIVFFTIAGSFPAILTSYWLRCRRNGARWILNLYGNLTIPFQMGQSLLWILIDCTYAADGVFNFSLTLDTVLLRGTMYGTHPIEHISLCLFLSEKSF